MSQIPKVIHYVWLGDEKPQMIKDCLASWSRVMPDYEIREWGMADAETIKSEFLHSAIKTRKWAFAADFLRVWILYHYGGIYMDTDIFVYQRFDKFLEHRAFSGIEFWAPDFYKSLKSKKIRGIGVDSAILGAEKGHPWIKDILSFYEGKVFIDKPEYFMKIIMPMVITEVSMKYGFRYAPSFQVLKEDIHLYPHDVFSAVYDMDLAKLSGDNYYLSLGEKNKIRHSCHLCANSWGYVIKKPNIFCRILFSLKKMVLSIFGKKIVYSLKNVLIKEKHL